MLDFFLWDPQGYYLDSTTNDKGGSSYIEALNLLANQDEYDFNLLLLPGILHDVHSVITTKAIDVCENRGDAFVVVDSVGYSTTNLSTVKSEFESVSVMINRLKTI